MGKRKKPSVQERRKLMVGIATCIGGLAFTGYKIATDGQEITFADAKSNPALRQKYLDTNELFSRPYIRKLMYLEKNLEGRDAAAETPYHFGQMGKKMQFTIEVYNKAFLGTEADFLNGVIDHEIEGHVKHFHFGHPLFTEEEFKRKEGGYPRVLQDVLEAAAYQAQISAAKARGVSDASFNAMLTNYRGHYGNLLRAQGNTQLANPEVIDRVAVSLFSDFMAFCTSGGRPVLKNENEHIQFLHADQSYIHVPETLCKRLRGQ